MLLNSGAIERGSQGPGSDSCKVGIGGWGGGMGSCDVSRLFCIPTVSEESQSSKGRFSGHPGKLCTYKSYVAGESACSHKGGTGVSWQKANPMKSRRGMVKE